jgi:hypothetical protein
MWVLYSRLVAMVVNVVLLVFLVIFIVNGIDIMNQLHITEEEAVSGRFQDFNKYQNISDLDNQNAYSHSGSRGLHDNSGIYPSDQARQQPPLGRTFNQNYPP